MGKAECRGPGLTRKEVHDPEVRNMVQVSSSEVRGTVANTTGKGLGGRAGMGYGPDIPNTVAPEGPGSRPGRAGACSRGGGCPDTLLPWSPALPSTVGFPCPRLGPS